jgi:hypothetical protein
MARGNNRNLHEKSSDELAYDIDIQIQQLIKNKTLPPISEIVEKGLTFIDPDLLNHSNIPYNAIHQIFYYPRTQRFYLELTNFCEEFFIYVRSYERNNIWNKPGCNCVFENNYQRFEILKIVN